MLRIIALFRKIKNKLKKKKEAKGKGPQIPEGNKIAVFGHTNVGKTVFFVMLHEAAMKDPHFRLDTKDDQTASELESNLRLLKGLEASVSEGVRTEKRVERRFPPPTSETKLLNFVAVLNQRKRFDFTSLDYRGEIASIEEQPELKESLIKFSVNSDCVLFFIEPHVIFSELYCRNQLASFKSLLQLLMNGKSSLSIPVGLVVTKADLLDGFEDESQTVLVSRSHEYAKSKRYDQFVQRVLDQPHIKRNERWRKDLRKVLEHLEDFFETLSGLSLDFQVFFVSATGTRPPQMSDNKGGTVFVPPRQLKPIGVKEPFKWAVNRALFQKKIKSLKRITNWVFWLAFIWCLFFSIPNLLNLGFWYPKIFSVEQEIRKSGCQRDLSKLSEEDRKHFKESYRKYSNRTLVSAFFGMGKLEEFARQRLRELETSTPPEPKKPPVDSAYLIEKPASDQITERFGELKKQIDEGSPGYRLETAPPLLESFRDSISALVFSSSRTKSSINGIISKINTYLSQFKCWNEKKTFDISVEGIPRDYELYVIIEGQHYGKMFNDLPECPNVSWQKGQPVVYSLTNRKGGRPIEKAFYGNYAIVDSVIEIQEARATLKITKKGFDCKLPSL